MSNTVEILAILLSGLLSPRRSEAGESWRSFPLDDVALDPPSDAAATQRHREKRILRLVGRHAGPRHPN